MPRILTILLLILVCPTDSISFASNNVVFQKLSDITTARSRWLVAFKINLNPYDELLNELSNLVNQTLESTARVILFHHGNSKRYAQILSTNKLFRNELANLEKTRLFLKSKISEIKSIHSETSRGKRSLIPIVGKALSFLFGTLSESDVSSIINNINSLARNQQNIVHVLHESLSVIQVSQKRISENRKTINKVIQGLTIMANQSEIITQEVKDLHRFMDIYTKIDRMIGEARDLVRISGDYLQHIELQLNMLALGHLSPSLISPKDLRGLLTEIESKLPRTFRLPANPNTNLWLLYRTLTCATVLHNDSIVVVLSIPLLDNERRFELYKVHNLAVPIMNETNIEDWKLTAKYRLEASHLAINMRRTQYALLTENEVKDCVANQLYCRIRSPVYSVTSSKLCIIKLFLKVGTEINEFCSKIVNTNIVLPQPNAVVHTICFS